jgi:hypothetical protein
MNKPALFLRIAATLILIEGVLHTIGGVFGKPDPGPMTTAWMAMQANHFPLIGLDRTYAQVYTGFGLCITISCILEGLVLWLISNRMRTHAALLRPIIGLFAVGYLALTIIAYTFIFAPPAISNFIVFLCLAAAYFFAKQENAEGLRN